MGEVIELADYWPIWTLRHGVCSVCCAEVMALWHSGQVTHHLQCPECGRHAMGLTEEKYGWVGTVNKLVEELVQ